ncbi:hypothetical protein BDZ90DRAFT_217753 [Jaminaea rosea]|uniref:Uncharacterized protein n=1 Tax=Jaminaea rosea TaxID=1569628 RepID=A0A316UTX9_9BASI|nr:hypothetical protein BDZ90DRAFT_217753 [Jaminaea rosea]PWN28722.1 hypothetical protein BDZ90DRAFT_217753 [Jaminaea rosea]
MAEDPHPFRYKSFNDRLASVHLSAATGLTSGRGSTLAGLDVHGVAPSADETMRRDEDDDFDTEEARMAALQASTAFGSALNAWSELNLTVPFVALLRSISQQSLSLPLLIHYRSSIVEALCSTLLTRESDSHLAYEPVLDLIPRLALDLGSEFLPVYPPCLDALLKSTTITKNATAGDEQGAARIVEKAFESVAALFRNLAPLILKKADTDDGHDLLRETWTIMRPYMGWVAEEEVPHRTPPHVRRFASEAFSHLLRRSKQQHLRNAATFMLADAQAMLDQEPPRATMSAGVAGVWSEVAKSVDRRLHSQATSHLSALLLAGGREVARARLLVGKLLLTSLVHHGQSAHLAPIFQLLVEWLKQRQESGDTLALEEVIRWLIAAMGTRKGNRVDDICKAQIFAALSNLVASVDQGQDNSFTLALSSLITTALPIGRIPDLVGPGIKIVDKLAKARQQDGTATPLFITVVLSLADSETAWSGFRQFVLPQVLGATLDSISRGEKARAQALHLLASLVEADQLAALEEHAPNVVKWRRVVGEHLELEVAKLDTAIKQGEHSLAATQTPLAALRIVPLFAGNAKIAASLRSCIKMLAGKIGDDEGYQESPVNARSLLAVCATALVAVASSEKALLGDVCSKTLCESALHHLSAHRSALQATLELFNAGKASAEQLVTASTASSLLTSALMSEDEHLRQAATGWVAACSSSGNTALASLFATMSTIEQIPLRVETVRDRNVRLRGLVRELMRLDVEAPNDEEVKHAAQVVCRFVAGTLKLNFKPLWEECRKGLADMVGRFGDTLWEVAFEELVATRSKRTLPAEWSTEEEAKGSLDTVEEDAAEPEPESDLEATFIDPQRSARSQRVHHYWADSHRPLSILLRRQLVKLQTPQGRLDVANYRAQILLLFSEQPQVVEKHNHDFMEHFFGVVEQVGLETREEHATSDEDHESATSLSARLDRLSSYLKVFTKFSNPKALYRSSELHALLYKLVARSEVRLQKLALECVMTWKDPTQKPYEEKMYALLEQGKFRDELVGLDLSANSTAVQPQHRGGVMPLIIRLLFGLAIAKRTSASGAGKRIAILNALSECTPDELGEWVGLMLAPFSDQRHVVSPSPPTAFPQQQEGYLSLLSDVIKHLGAQLVAHWPSLVSVTINLAYHSSLKAAEEGPGRASAQSRDIRQNAVRRLADFYRCPGTEEFDWSAFEPAIQEHLVQPRLPLFAAENTQSPSALLYLFAVWSTRQETLKLLDLVLPSVYAVLAVPSVKPAVVTVILDLIDRLLTFSEDDTAATPQLFVSDLVTGLAPALHRSATASTPDPLLQREVQLLARLASFVDQSSDAELVLSALGPMMKKSNRLIPEKSKADLLATFRDLLLLTDSFKDPQSELFKRHYDLFSSMWSRLRSRDARLNLAGLFEQISRLDTPNLSRVAGWVRALNAYSERRLDEVDFDKRLDAFDELTSEDTPALTAVEWQPIVHNALFFLQDADELVLRTNAAAVLKRFVSSVAVDASHEDLFVRTVFPGLKRTLKARSELVRREALSVLDAAVKELPHLAALDEMRGLLAGGDEEANFFHNIHHVQLHRRARALRRLSDHAATGALKSKTLTEVLLPLIGHFLEAGHTEIGDHNLVNETIACMGSLCRHLQWGAYNGLLWKYLKLADGKTQGEKVFVRTAMGILDNFHFAMEDEIVPEEGDPAAEAEVEVGEEDEAEMAPAPAHKPRDDVQQQKVISSVTTKLLPALMGYLEHHDDKTDDAIRLPIAVGVVRVVDALPSSDKEIHLSKLLNVLSNVFRSKSQETRDLARETLCKTAVALGPARLGQIIKEQRRALTRGPQLAILAFNVHSLLVHLMQSSTNPLTLLDDAVVDAIISIAAEDLFGHTGEDRETIESRTKVKEMRHSKSLDTFEQVSKMVSPQRMRAVLEPLKKVLEETEVPRSMKAVEDALRRIASGINANQHFDAAGLLGLCHALIGRNAAFLKARKAAAKSSKSGVAAANGSSDLVLLKRKDVEAGKSGSSSRDHFAVNAYRFVAFGLDLLITALRRTRFDFSDVDVLGRLDPLLADVGNTLYAADSYVLSLGLKAAGALLRVPSLPSLQASLPIYIRQTTSILTREANPSSDVSQSGLKTLTVILRDCPSADFKEKQLSDLLSLVLPEIEEPGSQSAIFAFVRAIVSRRFVVPEVYDVMDRVAEMVVTNQSSQVREVSRAAFLQFLLDYPQGKGRLKNQLEFLAKNASGYTFEAGRMSTMELLGAIFAKFSDEVLREYGELFFVTLVMVLANDEATKCRERAAVLLKALLGIMGAEQRARFVGMTHAWAEGQKQELGRVGLQVYGLFLDAGSVDDEGDSQWTNRALRNVRKVLSECADALEELEQEQASTDFDTAMDIDLDWQLPYHALQVLFKLTRVPSVSAQLFTAPNLSNKDVAATWSSVRRLLLFPHAWVRSASSRLLGALFAGVGQPTEAMLPRSGSSMLSVENLVDAAKKMSLQLRSEALDDALALQIVKNLLWVGRAFALVSSEGDEGEASGDDDDDGSNAADSEDGSDDDDGEEDGPSKVKRSGSSLSAPLPWLFTKLSYLARPSDSAPLTSTSILTPQSVLRWFAAMAQHLSVERLTPFLPHIVTPIWRITETRADDQAGGKKMSAEDGPQQALRGLAIEVQELVQGKVGASRYGSVVARVAERVNERRRQRREQRRRAIFGSLAATIARKEKRNAAKHASRKRKNNSMERGRGVRSARGMKRVRQK